MTKIHKIVVSSVLFLCFFPFPDVKSAEKEERVFQLAAKRIKNVKWDKKSIIAVDINCDGNKDYALLGKSKQGVTVALIVGPFSEKSRIESFEFFVGKPWQDSLCKLPARLEIRSLDYDPAEMVGKLPGFRRSKKCNAFCLADNTCDSFHFYWDHQTNTLAWWRL
ncbi:MAG: hypothetical protein B6D35_04135 [Candidatus Brocadia sp. UTAMX2]|jgi:hypothetical protein|nr:MAG: hypothetical protein B6D35_04135 [Candidatus Brocadia sp. UTAMX2]